MIPELQPQGLSLDQLRAMKLQSAAARAQTILNIANGIYKDLVVHVGGKDLRILHDSFPALANASLGAADALITAFEARYGGPPPEGT